MKNPNPITRARRIEMRRKELGSNNPQCFYCGESDIECLELDHPVGRKRDPKFTRIVCRNCHRKLEFKRDLAGLTNNGLHRRNESPLEELRSYLSLLAEDQDSITELLQSPAASPQLIARALQSTADSLRRKVSSLSLSQFQNPVPITDAPEPTNAGCAQAQPEAH